MTITASAHISDIVHEAPATIAVFQRHGLEFCCAGHVPLRVACEHQGLDLALLLEELDAALVPLHETRDWRNAPLTELVAHIQAQYHQPLYEELPRLAAMLAKVVRRHGERLPHVLLPLQKTFSRLDQELALHMRREDAVLFPAIVRFEAQPELGTADPHPLLGPITVMEHDHDEAGQGIHAMRALTRGYEPPDDACPTFRGLYYGLGEFEHRMALHVKL